MSDIEPVGTSLLDADQAEVMVRYRIAQLLRVARCVPATEIQKRGTEMTDAQIKYMVNRFLGWKLPDNFSPDNGISATRPNYAPNVVWELVGTNLLDADQAEVMVRYMIDGIPH